MSALPWWLDALIALSLLVGAVFSLLAAWALFRLEEVRLRLHVASLAGSVGLGGVLLGSALYFGYQHSMLPREGLILLFVLLTTPLSAQALGNAVSALYPHAVPVAPSSAESKGEGQ